MSRPPHSSLIDPPFNIHGQRVQILNLLTHNFCQPSHNLILQKGFNMRIKEIHLVNVPPFADAMVNLLKMVLKPKLVSRVSRKPD